VRLCVIGFKHVNFGQTSKKNPFLSPSLQALPTVFSCQSVTSVTALITIAKPTFDLHTLFHPVPPSPSRAELVELVVFAKVKMPIIIYPNLGAQPIGAVPARTAPPPPSALIRRGSGFSKSFKASLRNRSSSSLESSFSGRSSRDTLADTYQLTRGTTPLNTTLLPSKSRSPVYCVTTDVHPDGACATTHLWHFDRDRRSLRDVAWIRWSSSSQPVVGVVGVQLPVNDFLVKSKGLGFSSRCVHCHSKVGLSR